MSDPAKALQQFMERVSLTQAELGGRLGASQAQVSRLIHGGCPTLEQAIAAKRVVGIDVEDWPWTGAMAAYVKQRARRAG